MAISAYGKMARRDGIFQSILGIGLTIWVIRKGYYPPAILSSLLAASGILMACRTRAGIWSVLASDIILLAWFIWPVPNRTWGLKDVAILALLWSCWDIWKSYGPILRKEASWDDPSDPEEAALLAKSSRSAPSSSDAEKKPLISIVLLQRRAMDLNDDTLTRLVHKAWSHPRLASPDPDELFAVGKENLFIVRNPVAMWGVRNHPHPYLDKEVATKDLRELRLRKAIFDHEAWISVDLMHPFDSDLPRDLYYPYIFRLIGELADEDTLAILRPETGQINVWNEKIADSLRSAEPLEEFSRPSNPPVIPVADDDPIMVAAVEKARATFPDFRDRWDSPTEGDQFLVKGPVVRGDRSEYIWLSVTHLGYDKVKGNLENNPVDLGGLKIGDEVTLDLADLNDWAILPAEGPPAWGFHTVAAVDHHQRSGR